MTRDEFILWCGKNDFYFDGQWFVHSCGILLHCGIEEVSEYVVIKSKVAIGEAKNVHVSTFAYPDLSISDLVNIEKE